MSKEDMWKFLEDAAKEVSAWPQWKKDISLTHQERQYNRYVPEHFLEEEKTKRENINAYVKKISELIPRLENFDDNFVIIELGKLVNSLYGELKS